MCTGHNYLSAIRDEDRAESHDLKSQIFAIHSHFFRREEKRGRITKVVILSHAFLLERDEISAPKRTKFDGKIVVYMYNVNIFISLLDFRAR